MRNAYLADVQLDDTIIVNANLNRARLVKTNLTAAQVENCVVYGISAWQLVTTAGTRQRNLVIEIAGGFVLGLDVGRSGSMLAI